jgi:hypothetical protein
LLQPEPHAQGLLFTRRSIFEGQENPPPLGASQTHLADVLEQQLRGHTGALERQRIRDRLLKAAGAITYDQVEDEFRKLAKKLDWGSQATLKDFRHMFASSLANAGMPEPYRQYLMGHATSSATIAAYTHLNKVGEQYLLVADREWPSLLAVLHDKLRVPQLRRSGSA